MSITGKSKTFEEILGLSSLIISHGVFEPFEN
jgi:hypothetical protein